MLQQTSNFECRREKKDLEAFCVYCMQYIMFACEYNLVLGSDLGVVSKSKPKKEAHNPSADPCHAITKP